MHSVRQSFTGFGHFPHGSLRSAPQLSFPVVSPQLEFCASQNSAGDDAVQPHIPVTPPPPHVSGAVHCESSQQPPS